MTEKGDTRLLEPGWAGVLTLGEALFIRSELKANPILRRSWHIKRGCTLTKIAERAFPENPQEGRRNIINEMARANRRQKATMQENVENLDSHKKDVGQKDTISPQLSMDLSVAGV